MGEDTPEAVILTCPGCNTQFRLKPKKGRLPDGPVACPKCATDIPVIDSNLSEAVDDSEVPKRATLSGNGPVTSSEQTEDDAEEFEGFPDDDHSFADINLSENASRETGPKQTFLGMGPSSLKAVLGEESSEARPDEPTQLVDREDLGALRESSVVDEDADNGGFQESPTSGRLRRPRQLEEEDEAAGENEFNRETSEQKSVTSSDLRKTAEGAAADLRETAEGHSVEAKLDEFNDDVDESLAPPGLEDEDQDPTQVDERPDFTKSPRERGDAEHSESEDSEDDSSADDAEATDDASKDAADEKSTGDSPKKAVLGRLKLKKKLAARLKKNKAKDKKKDEDKKKPEDKKDSSADDAEETDEPSAGVGDIIEPPDDSRTSERKKAKSDDQITLDSDDQKTGKKPSLSELLKKARQKSKGESGLPRPRQSTTKNQRPQPTGEKLDRALQDIADETAEALTDEDREEEDVPSSERTTERLGKVGGTERLDKVSGPKKPGSGKRSSKEMMDLLRRKVAEKDQPGAASERRGSGYIRLPTAEIQDVLGQGTYRLRVENIVYEPVDKDGLTTLIKRGVLLGAAEIAEADGDWMQVQEHPVFHELRRKMAKEAHDLLADYRVDSDDDAGDTQDEDEAATDESAEPSIPPPRPADTADEQEEEEQPDANAVAEVEAPQTETVSEAEAAGIPTMEADLDEEPEDEPEEVAAEAPESDQTADADHSFELPKSESSIEFPIADAEPDEEQQRQGSQSGTPLSYPAIDPEKGPDQGTPGDQVPADDVVQGSPEKPSRGRRALITVLAILVVVTSLVALALSPIGRPYLEKYVGPIGGSASDQDAPAADKSTADPKDKTDGRPKVAAAVETASSSVADAAAIELADSDGVSAMAANMADAGDASAAATLLGAVHASAPDNPELAGRYIDALLESGRFTEARHEISSQLARGNDAEALKTAFVEATQNDPALGDYEPVVLTSGANADAVRAYPTWEHMNFQVVRGGEVTAVFKPSQEGWENGWRDEVAAWRLCEIMTCHFDVPRNRAARVTRSELESLLEAGSSEAQEAYLGQLDELDWQTEDIGGRTAEVVYGTLKDWPGEWAPFPIEETDVWRPWLSIPGADLDKPVSEALSELKNVQDGRFYEQLQGELDGATTRSMAGELSTILVFDYLTNNWDRFTGDEERYGLNNSFADGHFVSLNNGSAFQTRDSTRVKGRFGWTTRFSASTVASLKLMSPDFVSQALYPAPTGLDEAKLEVFWEMRRRALDRVESLSQARGEDNVLAFD